MVMLSSPPDTGRTFETKIENRLSYERQVEEEFEERKKKAKEYEAKCWERMQNEKTPSDRVQEAREFALAAIEAGRQGDANAQQEALKNLVGLFTSQSIYFR